MFVIISEFIDTQLTWRTLLSSPSSAASIVLDTTQIRDIGYSNKDDIHLKQTADLFWLQFCLDSIGLQVKEVSQTSCYNSSQWIFEFYFF